MATRTWVDGAAGGTPINANSLNAMEADITAAATSGQVRSKAKADGTDQTTVLQAEINALTTGAGGTLVLPSSSFGAVPIKVTNLTLANDGTTPAKQAALVIRGQGAHWSGRGTAIVGGTILEFTGTDTYGLLKTNGLGLLSITGVTFSYKGTGTTPFIYTTNTTLHIDQCAFVGSQTGAACNQDAIICGGLTNVEGAQGWNDGFQGYGTVISRNFFSGIRRAVYGRTFFNGNTIRDNTIWTTCGFTTGAAFELDGDAAATAAGSFAVGNVIRDNLIELSNYKWGVRLRYAAQNSVLSNNLFDKTATTLAGVRCETQSQNNLIYEGYTSTALPPIDDQAANNTFTALTPGIYSVAPPTKFSNNNYDTIINRLSVDGAFAMTLKPAAARADGTTAFEIKRSALEAANPSASVYQILQDGSITIDPTAASGGNITGPFSNFAAGGRTWSGVGSKAGQTNGATMTQDSGPGGSYFDLKNYAVRFNDWNGGPLRMRIGAGKDGFDLGATNDVTVQRDATASLAVNAPVKTKATTTAARPTGASAGNSAQIFDATLNKPIWSDGTNWQDATGVITPLATKTANYTAVDGDGVIVSNGASLTATLPDPTLVRVGQPIVVKNIAATALTVNSAGTAKTLDGASSQSLAQWGKATYVSDGTQWLTI